MLNVSFCGRRVCSEHGAGIHPRPRMQVHGKGFFSSEIRRKGQRTIIKVGDHISGKMGMFTWHRETSELGLIVIYLYREKVY